MMNMLRSPVALAFGVILIGLLIGKVKIRNISLDVSAVLLASVLAGFCISKWIPQWFDLSFQTGMAAYSKLGTSLFLSAIGLSAGHSMARGMKRRSLMYLLLGAGMVVAGALTMKLIAFAFPQTDRSLLLGILCGAMTSTPGLSAVCELPGILSENAIIGYGYSYLFGVVGVVLFVQCMTRKAQPQEDSARISDIPMRISKSDRMIPFCLSVLIGSFIGSFEFPLLNTSLGTSGGILCTSVVIGLIWRKTGQEIPTENLSCIRNLGLVLFFAGTGIPAGVKLNTAFHMKWILYGIAITVVPVLFGYLFARLILKRHGCDAMCVIAGGMTSTPAVGVLLRNPDLHPDLSAYSVSYFGALLTMMIAVPFL